MRTKSYTGRCRVCLIRLCGVSQGQDHCLVVKENHPTPNSTDPNRYEDADSSQYHELFLRTLHLFALVHQ